jgi:hypothetical protein
MTDTIPTLKECQIESASFAIRVDGPEDNKITLVGRSGKPFVAAVFQEQSICRLVAHRCNTFDGLVAAIESARRQLMNGGYVSKVLETIEFALNAAKGAAS